MKLPQFFIAGAPKCGTTFLAHYLARHPLVYMPRKELHYFGSDLHFTAPRISYDDYASHFAAARAEDVVGEASVWYLYSTRAAREIREFLPEARIIIMLRNPVDMLWSLHSQMLFTLNEDIPDFEQALAAEPERARGERLPGTVNFPAGLLYSRVARYAPQVRRYLATFDPDQIHVVLFDDLVKDPSQILSRSLEFLGVAPHGFGVLHPVNPATTLQSRKVRRILNRPPRLVRSVGRLLPRWLRHELIRAGNRANTRPETRGRIPDPVRLKIGPQFEADVRELESLINRDLSAWIRSWSDPVSE